MNHCCWGWYERKEEGRACANWFTVAYVTGQVRRTTQTFVLKSYRQPELEGHDICILAWWALWLVRLKAISIFRYNQAGSHWILAAAPGLPCRILEAWSWDSNPDFSVTPSSWWSQFPKDIYYKSLLKPFSSSLGFTVHIKNKSKTDRNTAFLGYKF